VVEEQVVNLPRVLLIAATAAVVVAAGCSSSSKHTARTATPVSATSSGNCSATSAASASSSTTVPSQSSATGGARRGARNRRGGFSFRRHAVVYAVSGDAKIACIAYSDSGGGEDTQATLPATINVRLPSGAYFGVGAQGNGGTAISCSVSVDGKQVARNSATGAHGVALCAGLVP
jgi:hypothetical protein